MNDRIRATEVRVVAPDGSQVGILALADALRIARELELDLVEVAPQARPPVCRLLDFGKYRYELAVKSREAKKKQSSSVLKEMRMRPKIDNHDYLTKKGHVARFLTGGHKVKVTIWFRGREMAHTEIGLRILTRLADDLVELATVETPAKLDGRNMTIVFNPTKKPPAKAEKPPKAEKASKAGKASKAKTPETEGEDFAFEVDEAVDIEGVAAADDGVVLDESAAVEASEADETPQVESTPEGEDGPEEEKSEPSDA